MRKFRVFVAYADAADEHLIIEADDEESAEVEALAWVCPWDTPTEIKVVEELIRRRWVKV